MNNSEYSYLQNKKWRAITYDWNTLSTYQPTSRMYCLTDFQVAWLLSNTEYMRWSSRWVDCPCTQQDLDAMKAEMEYNLMSCFDFQPWQLNYLYNQAQTAQFDRFNDLYDAGGIAELNANTPTDYYSGDASAERLDALCMACETYIKSYAQRWLQQAQLINGALSFIVGIITPVPYLQDIAIRVIGGLVGITQQKIDAMQSNDALDAVVCCMNSGLNGGAVNQTVFEGSLNACVFTPGSNSEIVREIIVSDIDNFDNWLTFLNALGDAYAYTSVGIDYACPCDTSWVYISDFPSAPNDWQFEVINGMNTAVYTVSVGWESTQGQDDGNIWNVYLIIEVNFATPVVVNSIEFNYDFQSGVSGTSAPRCRFTAFYLGGTVSFVERDGDNGTGLIMQSTPNTLVDRIEFSARPSRAVSSSVGLSGSVALNSVTITGEGTIPPELQ